MDDTTLMAESEEELNSLLMWVKEKSERAGLRLNIKKKKITHKDHGIRPHYYMANRRGKGESSDRFLLGRKAMTNLDSVLKSRDITLLKKVHIVKAMVFSVVTYGWTVKKAECQRIDAFKQCCWRSLLKVSWIARRSNQSILREINPE